MKNIRISAVAIASLALAGTAFAGNDKPMADKPANHGAAVSTVAQSPNATTPTEGAAVSTMAHSQRDFSKLDSNADGFLSSAEIAAHADLTARIGTYDNDADQKLSQVEYDAYIASTVTDEAANDEEAE